MVVKAYVRNLWSRSYSTNEMNVIWIDFAAYAFSFDEFWMKKTRSPKPPSESLKETSIEWLTCRHFSDFDRMYCVGDKVWVNYSALLRISIAVRFMMKWRQSRWCSVVNESIQTKDLDKKRISSQLSFNVSRVPNLFKIIKEFDQKRCAHFNFHGA